VKPFTMKAGIAFLFAVLCLQLHFGLRKHSGITELGTLARPMLLGDARLAINNCNQIAAIGFEPDKTVALLLSWR